MRKVWLIALLFLAVPAGAVSPDEVLSDHVLESRARELSSGLRCMVCQNQSIDDSDAELARDLRILVRERLVAGDTDAEVIDYLVSRYGEFVLLKPRITAKTALLWATPALVLLGGMGFAFFNMKRRKKLARPSGLSEDEEKLLERIMGEKD